MASFSGQRWQRIDVAEAQVNARQIAERKPIMKRECTLIAALWLSSTALALEPVQGAKDWIPPSGLTATVSETVVYDGEPVRGARGFLDGNHGFDNFIGFMSNPEFNIDPRPLPSSGLSSAVPGPPRFRRSRVPISGFRRRGHICCSFGRLSVGLNQGVT